MNLAAEKLRVLSVEVTDRVLSFTLPAFDVKDGIEKVL